MDRCDRCPRHELAAQLKVARDQLVTMTRERNELRSQIDSAIEAAHDADAERTVAVQLLEEAREDGERVARENAELRARIAELEQLVSQQHGDNPR